VTITLAQPRPYQGAHDLDAMRRILVAGRQAAGPVFYVHAGDLDWWLFYSEPDDRFDIHLWEAEPGGEPIAWALFSPYHTFDLFAHPAAVTREQRLAMFTWAEEHLAARLRAEGVQRMSTIWISEHDADAIAHLTARGFQRGESGITFMVRALDDLGTAPPLPPGFQIRPVAGDHEAELRAAPQYSAFESTWEMARYVARYRRFMQSSVYDAGRDLMVIAPDGQAAAFCIYWLDDVKLAGHLEPVGTHASFRHLGLGKAILWEGLRLMKEHGMEMATVCPESDSPAALGLYRSAGFRPVHDLWTFYKPLTTTHLDSQG
jgi:ribosomal protein S18 acetylase RimI-like enzyme